MFAATPSYNALAWMNGDTNTNKGVFIDSHLVGSFSIEVFFSYIWFGRDVEFFFNDSVPSCNFICSKLKWFFFYRCLVRTMQMNLLVFHMLLKEDKLLCIKRTCFFVYATHVIHDDGFCCMGMKSKSTNIEPPPKSHIRHSLGPAS